MELIKLFAFFLSIYGYVLLGNKKWKIDIEFLPAIIFSSIGCTVFLSGILNIMNIAFWGIFLAGICIVIYYLVKHDARIKVPFGVLFCVGLLVYLLFYLKDIKYTHYDNFTHWGLIVKNIFYDSSFPNFEDEIIKYQSYPTGSACFIWYVCKFIGYSEGNTLFAQAILNLSCAATLFVMCKAVSGRKKVAISLVVAFECIIWITYGANLWNGLLQLLVDILLATIATAAFMIVYYYREDMHKACVCVLPLIVFEVCIKNSGIMWVFAILIEMLYFGYVQKINANQTLMITAQIIGISLLFRKLWDAHVDMVFTSGSESSHAMTLENWTKVFNGKTEADLQIITQSFFERVFSISNTVLLQIILLIIFAIALLIVNKEIAVKSHILFGSIFLFGVYIVYQIGNYIMYIFSMPVNEALTLEGYDRYVMTIGFFTFGVLSIYFLELFDLLSINTGILKRCGMILMTLLIVGLFAGKSMFIRTMFCYKEPKSFRFRLDRIVDKYNLEEGKRSIIYIQNPDNNEKLPEYQYTICKYILYSKDITVVDKNSIEKLNESEQYDYVIILEHDETVDNWLKETSLPFENGEYLNIGELS